jgi:hypothetical protein
MIGKTEPQNFFWNGMGSNDMEKETGMKRFLWAMIVLLTCVFCGRAQAQYRSKAQELDRLANVPYSYHSVDWENRRYKAVAVGAYDPDKVTSRAQQKIYAKETAKILAQERLIMAAMGTRVSMGKSLVAHAQGVDLDISARLVASGVLERVTVDKTDYFEHPQGGIYAIVHVSAPMVGFNRLRELADQNADVNAEIDRIWENVNMEEQTSMSKADAVVAGEQFGNELRQTLKDDQAGLQDPPEPSVGVSENYTGLIVNASHLPGTSMAVLARVVTPSLRRVYGHEDVPRDIELVGSMVAYTTNVERARELPDITRGGTLVGDNPLVITASSTRPGIPGHLIISEADGSKIIAAGGGADGFLSRARVIFVQ